MKKSAIFVVVYAILVFIGGLMGFLKANSLPSLIMSGSFAFLLLDCAYFIWRGYNKALIIAIGLQLLLLVFFCYRFYLSFKFMPAGMMIALTCLCIGALIYQKACKKCTTIIE